MADYDVVANVVVLTPPQCADRIYELTDAFIGSRHRTAAGITRLPAGCGLLDAASRDTTCRRNFRGDSHNGGYFSTISYFCRHFYRPAYAAAERLKQME